MAEGSTAESVAREVETLRGLYSATAGLGRQDYEVSALIRGLLYVGNPARAKAQLEDFFHHTRRDLVPHSKELTELARSLGVAECRSASKPVPPLSLGRKELSADRCS